MDGGHFQDSAENLGHSPMAGKGLVVKKQILQGTFFDCLHHKAVGAVHRSDDLHSSALHLDGLGGAVPGTDAAAQAQLAAEFGLLLVGNRVLLKGNGMNRTDFGAFSAAHTGVLADGGDIVGGLHRLNRSKPPGGLQGLAAAATAVADEGGVFPDVFSNLHQVGIVCPLQHILGLLLGDQPGVLAVLGQRPGHISKSQAHIPGGVNLTGMSRMVGLVPAIAQPQADILGFLDDVGSTLIVQNVVHLGIGQHRLLDIDPAQLGFRHIEQVLDKILFHVHVLVV